MTIMRTCLASTLIAASLVASSLAEDAILRGAADPTIVAAPDGQEGFYLVNTGRGIPISYSSDLVRWERIGKVFPQDIPAWAKAKVPKARGFWAPDVSYHNGLYHVYYSVSSFGSQRSVIGLAVNRSLDPNDPNYRWIDRGLVIESLPGQCDFNAIDAALFVDRDGQWYLFFGSFWSGIKATRLDPATGKPPATNNPILPVAARPRTPPFAIEAAYVILREGYYYLFVSWDHCCDGADSDYKVMVGRSRSVMGPYVDQAGKPMLEGGGTLVLANHGPWRGPGHNGMFEGEDRLWMAHHTYHVANLKVGRALQIRPTYWTSDGWPVVGLPLSANSVADESTRDALRTAGRWSYSVDFRSPTEIKLLSDGRLRGQDRRGRWQRSASVLRLIWQPEDGTQTAATDEVILEPSGRSYVGRSEAGSIVRGIRKD